MDKEIQKLRKDVRNISLLPNKKEINQKIENLLKSLQENSDTNRTVAEHRAAEQLLFCFQTYVYTTVTDIHLEVLKKQKTLKEKKFSFLCRKEEIFREMNADLDTAKNTIPLLPEELKNEQESFYQDLVIENKTYHNAYLHDLEKYKKNPEFLAAQRTDISHRLKINQEISEDLAARSASLFTATESAEDFAIMGESSERTVHAYFQRRARQQPPSKKDFPPAISLESIRELEQEILFRDRELIYLKTEAIRRMKTNLEKEIVMKRVEMSERTLAAMRTNLYESTLGKFYPPLRESNSPPPSTPRMISLEDESTQARKILDQSRGLARNAREKLSSAAW